MIPRHQLRLLIESVLLESVKSDQRYLIEKYPQHAARIGALQNRWIDWLAARYGPNPIRRETDSFDNALDAVENYPLGAADKYNTNEYFRNLIDEKLPLADRSWKTLSDPTMMTVADALEVSRLNKKKKPRIEVNRSQSTEKDKIAEVGPWKIYEAPDRESSCNIIGLKPGTDEPRADVCIARTDASNLFYNYASDYSIFTVMRGDNPIEDDILIFGYNDDGSPEFRADPRRNPTVDGHNDALTPARVAREFGEHHDQIMSIMRSHVLSRQGPSPARQKINSAASNIRDYNDVLRGISQAEALSLKQAIASRSGISPEVQARLLPDSDKEVRQHLAANSDISQETMMQLAQDPDHIVKSHIIANPNVPHEVLDFIARNETEPTTLSQIARKRRTSPDTLVALIGHPEDGVRISAAGNPRTPPEALMRAARRGTPEIRRAVAQNTSAGEEILRYLADDPEEQVRNAVIMNRNAPPELAQQIRSGGSMAGLRQLIRRML
jgi:uncharacterized protein (DUF2336 family)